MIQTYAVIPFKNEADMTVELLWELAYDKTFSYMYLFNNGSRQEETDKVLEFIEIADLTHADWKFEHVWANGEGIYHMWNQAWRAASFAADGPFNMLFLNNDITIPQPFVAVMAAALRASEDVGIVYPNYDKSVEEGWDEQVVLRSTRGTYKDGGMCGWAFMVRGEAIRDQVPYVDENLKWWYGDDVMERNFRAAGYKTCRIEGLPVDHINEATANNGENGWTHKAKQDDVAYWNETYG